MRASALILISGVVIVGVVAGCGGGSKKASPETWVPKACSQIVDWNEPVQAGGTKVQNLNNRLSKPGVFDSSALKTARNQYAAVIARLVSVSTRFRAALEELDPPDVKDGEKMQQAIIDGLTKLVPALKKAKRQLASMRTDYSLTLEIRNNEVVYSPANPEFMNDISRFMDPVDTALDNTYSPLRLALNTPELKAVADKTPECPSFG